MSIDLTAPGLSFDGNTLTFTIQNNGSDPVGPTSTGIYLSTDVWIDPTDTLLGTISTPALQPGMTATQSSTIHFATNTPGDYYLGVVADNNNAVAESDETNNFSYHSSYVILGDANANNLTGLNGNDFFVGNGGNDTIHGLAGDDTYVYTTGYDVFDGGTGSDTLNLANTGAAVWFGYDEASGIEAWTRDGADLSSGAWRALADTTSVENVIGTPFDDTLKGDGNANTIAGGGGNDTVILGAGDDTYVYSSGYDHVDFGTGNDTLDFSHSAGAVWFSNADPSGVGAWGKFDSNGAPEQDLSQGNFQPIVAATPVHHIVGSEYGDTFVGDSSDDTYTYTGGPGTGGLDTFVGAGGTDTLDMSKFGAAILFGTGQSNQNEVSTTDHNDLSQGATRGIVDITYADASDGHGGLSVERVIGTSFDDTINADGADPNFTYVYTGGFDTYNGTAATETLDLSQMRWPVLYDSSNPNGHTAYTTYTSDLQSGTLTAFMDASNINNIIGTPYSDTIKLGPEDNVVTGNGGTDTVYLGDGTNSFVYTTGFADVHGGSGQDTIDLSGMTSCADVILLDNQVWTNGLSSLDHVGNPHVIMSTSSIENVIGTPYDDVIYGTTADNTYIYTGGFDTVVSYAGYDTVDMSRFGSAILFGTNNPNGIEISTTDHSDLTQGTLRGIVDIAFENHNGDPALLDNHEGLAVEHIIGTAFNDTINADPNDPEFTYSYTGGFDTYNGTSNVETLDLSHFGGAIWYGNDPSGIEVWAKFDATTGNPEQDLSQGNFQAIVDVSDLNNVIGTAYADQIRDDATANQITGGGGADLLTGGGGGDTYNYGAVSDSTSLSFDTVFGFDAASDKFHFGQAVTGLDAPITVGALSAAGFDGDLSAAIGASQLLAGHAVLFTPSSGDFSGHGDNFLIVDANGVAGYQAGADYVIDLHNIANIGSLSTGDFI